VLKEFKQNTWDIANCIYYNRAKFQHEIPCCVGSGKQFGQILEKNETIHAPRSRVLLLSPMTEYKVFQIINLHNSSICTWLHPGNFLNFFEALKFEFFGG
jgi:hypothetical protein